MFNHIAGSVKNIDLAKFRLTVFRVTKGNSYFNFEPIDLNDRWNKDVPEPIHFKEERGIFVIIFRGETRGYTENRLKRLCTSFGIELHDLPELDVSKRDYEKEINEIIIEQKQIYKQNLNILKHDLKEFQYEDKK